VKGTDLGYAVLKSGLSTHNYDYRKRAEHDQHHVPKKTMKPLTTTINPSRYIIIAGDMVQHISVNFKGFSFDNITPFIRVSSTEQTCCWRDEHITTEWQPVKADKVNNKTNSMIVCTEDTMTPKKSIVVRYRTALLSHVGKCGPHWILRHWRWR
jgi:hypothetical protein